MLRRTVAGLALWAAMSVAAWRRTARSGSRSRCCPTLDRAELSAEGFSEQLPDVSGFYLGSGWYSVVLGPYAPDEAQSVMANLLAEASSPTTR
jgi:hypothetical protein